MTAVVIIERPSSDAFSDAEIDEVLAAAKWWSFPWAYTGFTPAIGGLFDIARTAAATIGLAADADHHLVHVEYLRYPIVAGYRAKPSPPVTFPGAPVGGRINAGERTETLVQLDDPASYSGGQFEIELDDGSFVAIPRSKGCVAVWRMTRRYRWSQVTAGTPRFLRLLSVVASEWGGPLSQWGPG